MIPPGAAPPAQAVEDLPVEAALRKGTEFLRALGIEAARLEMELILADALGMDRLNLYLNLKRPLGAEAREKSRAALARRKEREPLAYILGSREFYGLKFEVSAAVLVPRPETELLVDRAIRRCQELAAARPDAPPRFADIGAGSGAIAVAVARALKKQGVSARGIATDISSAALEIAARNAAAHDCSDMLGFKQGAFYEPLDGAVDAILANPPYIAEGERAALMPEVARWEPAEALFSGDDGLGHLRELIDGSRDRLDSGGALLLEIGFGQRDAVEAMLRAAPWLESIQFHNDLASIPRVAEATRIA